MPFSEKVQEEALVACGRHCCICHKFAGTHIEIHHIEQEADGGSNEFDNAIPLCFDCHADMGKTDPRHPKRKAYTVNELKRHRDNWYKYVANGTVDQTDDDTLKYRERYYELRDQANYVLSYYANVYGCPAYETDKDHEEACRALRDIGIKFKVYAQAYCYDLPGMPSRTQLAEVAGEFIGLSNSVYAHTWDKENRLLDMNYRRGEQIYYILGLDYKDRNNRCDT